MSAAEEPEVVTQIQKLGWDVQSVPGAGHKLMKVALGMSQINLYKYLAKFCC